MIILRQKEFRRDPMPDNKFIVTEDLINELGISEINISIQESKKFNEQFSNQFLTEKSVIKKLKKDIRQGYLYEDGPAGGDTHFLSDFSHKDSHVLSKKITEEDRLNYRIYEPVIEDSKNGPVWNQKIVLESCKGHELNGTPDYVKNKKYKNLKRKKNDKL